MGYTTQVAAVIEGKLGETTSLASSTHGIFPDARGSAGVRGAILLLNIARIFCVCGSLSPLVPTFWKLL